MAKQVESWQTRGKYCSCTLDKSPIDVLCYHNYNGLSDITYDVQGTVDLRTESLPGANPIATARPSIIRRANEAATVLFVVSSLVLDSNKNYIRETEKRRPTPIPVRKRQI